MAAGAHSRGSYSEPASDARLWEQGAGGSNPLTPTILLACSRPPWMSGGADTDLVHYVVRGRFLGTSKIFLKAPDRPEWNDAIERRLEQFRQRPTHVGMSTRTVPGSEISPDGKSGQWCGRDIWIASPATILRGRPRAPPKGLGRRPPRGREAAQPRPP